MFFGQVAGLGLWVWVLENRLFQSSCRSATQLSGTVQGRVCPVTRRGCGARVAGGWCRPGDLVEEGRPISLLWPCSPPPFPSLLGSASRRSEMAPHTRTKTPAEEGPAAPRGVLGPQGLGAHGASGPLPRQAPGSAVTAPRAQSFLPGLATWSLPEGPLPSSPGSELCSRWRPRSFAFPVNFPEFSPFLNSGRHLVLTWPPPPRLPVRVIYA